MAKTCVYSVVIPVYNSVDTLRELAERISAVFRKKVRSSFEIIFVDDASPNPATWPALTGICKRYPNVKAVQLMRNFGQIPALLCGICESRGDFVITMDDDLQHMPEDIPKLIAERNHDIVVGSFDRLSHGPLRQLTHRVKGWLDRMILGKPHGVALSSLLLLSKRIADGMRAMQDPYPLMSYLLFSQTQDVVSVPATHSRRREGKSGYSHYKRFQLFTNLIINHSPVLLSTVGLFGVFLTAITLILILIQLIRNWIFDAGLNQTVLMFLVLLSVSGILLFSAGVIGKYLFRILKMVEGHPPFQIRQKVGHI